MEGEPAQKKRKKVDVTEPSPFRRHMILNFRKVDFANVGVLIEHFVDRHTSGIFKMISIFLNHQMPHMFHYPHTPLFPVIESPVPGMVREVPSWKHAGLRRLLETADDVDETPNDENYAQGDSYTIFYGDSAWYAFIRKYHKICKSLAEMNSKCYGTLLEILSGAVQHPIYAATYEQTIRKELGPNAEKAFFLDSLVASAGKMLQSLLYNNEFWELYEEMRVHGCTTGKVALANTRIHEDTVYYKVALNLFEKKEINFGYKFTIISGGRMIVELLDVMRELDGGNWWEKEENMPPLTDEERKEFGKTIFLSRNMKGHKSCLNKKEKRGKRVKVSNENGPSRSQAN